MKSLVVYGPPLIIRGGNVSGDSDPLMRFNSSVDRISLSKVTLIDSVTGNGANGSKYIPPWSDFFASHPSLQLLSLDSCSLGGPIPSSVPSHVVMLDLPGNALNGTLSFSLIHSALRSLDLSSNEITGTIPANLFSAYSGSEKPIFHFNNNRLSGPIPATLLANMQAGLSEIDISFEGNALSGAIPSTLFTGSPNVLNLVGMRVSFNQNQLSGSIPSSLLSATFPNLQYVYLQFNGNKLDGSIPTALTSSMIADQFSTLWFSASSNQLTGSVPRLNEHVGQLTALSFFGFYFADNQLSGSLPSNLLVAELDSSYARVEWDLSGNSITGTIPSTLLETDGIYEVDIYLDRNSLTGTLPANIIHNSSRVTLSLAHNQLQAPLQPLSLHNVFRLTLDLSSNAFGGTLPTSFLSSLTADIKRIKLMNCSFTGSLPTIPASTANTYELFLDNNGFLGSHDFKTSFSQNSYLKLSVSNNYLTGSIDLDTLAPVKLWVRNNRLAGSINFYNAQAIYELDISGNTGLTGTLPAQIFDSIQILFANRTSLTGKFPSISGWAFITDLDLSYTSIEFCSPGPLTPNTRSLEYCQLQNTTATQCTFVYPSVCRYTDPPVVSNPPATPSSPSSPSSSPTPANSPDAPKAPTSASSSLKFNFGGFLLVLLSLVALMNF